MGGQNISSTFEKETKKYLKKTYNHYKAIGATHEGTELVRENIQANQPGIVLQENARNFADNFIQAVTEYRHWERQLS